jgi:hypothetical protein
VAGAGDGVGGVPPQPINSNATVATLSQRTPVG